MIHTKIKVLKSGTIKTARDLLTLKIVDWNRLIDYWDDPAEASEAIASWLIATNTHYSIMKCNMEDAPERSNWPGWEHIGNHPDIGEMLWNWFHWDYRGEIYFSDSPDFHGTLKLSKHHSASFYGDIGLVSAPTFMRSIKMLKAHDAWITIVDSDTQIMLEPLGSIMQLWNNYVDSLLSNNADNAQKYQQMSLF